MSYTHGTKDTLEWMRRAKPEPSQKDLSTQIGVHFEEVAEFIETLKVIHSDETVTDDMKAMVQKAYNAVNDLAYMCKNYTCMGIDPNQRVDALDGLADQIVTAVGVAHCAGMDPVGALNEVNRSNFSKFDDNGNPLLDINRKIIKGPNYSKPDLKPFV